jgi:glycosyltransferase involved in cell wall biosynthesis
MFKRNRLSILYVSYPLLTVTPESAGGAEQMLLAVEREMAIAGHRTTVAAADGSQVKGRLLATGLPADGPDQYDQRECEHSKLVLEYLRGHPREFDLIHDKSGSFFRHAAECGMPVLATLHLPRSFYREDQFRDLPPNLFFNCVSHSQAASFADLPNFLGVVENGIHAEDFPLTKSKRDYLLWLGRICEEKAPHLAIAAAHKTGLPLVIAGQVYPFQYHQDYFNREIRPHLSEGSPVCFIDSPSRQRKLDLLRDARALLLTSTAEETSSLVAMEAMACGTPVIAFRRGAFPEIVADGGTGFVVESLPEMLQALREVDQLSPEGCRTRVERHFNASRMARDYQELYRRVLMSAKGLAA